MQAIENSFSGLNMFEEGQKVGKNVTSSENQSSIFQTSGDMTSGTTLDNIHLGEGENTLVLNMDALTHTPAVPSFFGQSHGEDVYEDTKHNIVEALHDE